MGTKQTLPASARQFAHGLRATMKLNMTNILKEIHLLVGVSEVCCYVGELGVVRVALDKGGEERDKLQSSKLERIEEEKISGFEK